MGTLVFQANLGGAVNLAGPNIASTVNFTLPSADGSSGQALTTNGSGTLSFATVSGTPGGSNTQVQFNNSGVFGGSANLTFNGTTLTANTLNLTNALTSGYGGTGLTTFTAANNAIYSTSSSALTAGTLPVLAGGTGVTTSTGSGSVVLGTSPTLTTPTVTGYTESVVAIGTVTSSFTLAITSGTVLTATLTASTACTFTMPTATAGKSFVLLLKQAATTGNGTATFTGVKWPTAGAPTITATAGKMDILTFVADGTSWYGSYVQGYTP